MHPYRYMFIPMTQGVGSKTKYYHVGELIKMYRMAHNLTQAQFASLVRAFIVSQFPYDENILKKVSLRQTEVSAYERKRCCPKIDKLTAITQTIGIDPMSHGYECMTGYTKVVKTEQGFEFVTKKRKTAKADSPVKDVINSHQEFKHAAGPYVFS